MATKATKARKETILKALEEGHTVSFAAGLVGVHRVTVYKWRDSDPEFREAFDQAMQTGVDLLEAEARKRAVEGSDSLLMFLLKGKRPHEYRERYELEHRGGEQPVELVIHLED
jgi:transposase-like protein